MLFWRAHTTQCTAIYQLILTGKRVTFFLLVATVADTVVHNLTPRSIKKQTRQNNVSGNLKVGNVPLLGAVGKKSRAKKRYAGNKHCKLNTALHGSESEKLLPHFCP
jgi:hypothetical protein